MDENKNLNAGQPEENQVSPEEEAAAETAENTEGASDNAEAAGEADKKAKKEKKEKKEKRQKPKKLRNQALLRRGGFSIAITAAVLAGIIVVNILVSALADRFVLEFDMSTEKQNSMSEENIDYLRDLDTEVEIIVCATPEDYVGGYMSYLAQNMYGVSSDATQYYDQTIKLLDKYPAYNSKISLRYVDTQSSEFNEITSTYSNEQLNYGDIIVSCEKNGSRHYKVVGFDDIYNLSEDSTYAAYGGYTMNTVSGNNVETAVTSAIAYATSDKEKKVAILTGHSKNDYTSDYQTLLKANNYEIDVISDSMVSEISSDYDAVIIPGPTTDFMGTELDAISEFLENDGKLGKGLIFFADTSAPYLTNLYDFLEQWGIAVGEGILFETNSQNYMPDDPTTLGSYPATSDDDIVSGMNLFITGYNIPLTAAFDSQNSITVTTLAATPESVVAAPVGTTAGWTGADDYTQQSYSTVMQADFSEYNDDNELISSYVMAFSSIEFLQSAYNEQSAVSNKNMTLAAAERAVGAEDTGISFISKTITNESFADSVTQSSASVVRIIFMFILPIACIAVGIYIFIRRKNA